ncbi:DUF2971 domain-containing protein [uncultured Tolumonas sp.]|uniref:DUF2971 domain-containing protein n=1 Tax=uncultured Tolumonas sp. TaxID=263765 RepID=UPI0029306DD7|nr:DUF2971 domain-containing protein [uncultured Tolumonas sp.]
MKNFNNFNEFLHQDKPKLLWHYTSLTALNGIISNENKLSFWVTEINYLNDKSEYMHGLSIIKQTYNKFRNENKNNPLASGFLERVDPFFIFHNGDTTSTLDQETGVFVLSFTESKDLLSQWRAYTPQCHGVSIGIDPNFQSILQGKSILYPVIYNEKFQLEYAEHLFNDAFGRFAKGEDISSLHNNNVMAYFFATIKAACSLMKSDSFSEESEWRYIIYGENIKNIKFRESEYYLIPYINLDIENKNLKNIIIGPNPHNELCKKSLDLLLKKSNIPAAVAYSRIPFRG